MAITEVEKPLAAIASGMSPLGAMAVAVRGGEVIGVRFGHASERACIESLHVTASSESMRDQAGADAGDSELAGEVLERLLEYADGYPTDFRQAPVAVGHLSAFQRRVVRACRSIPAGEQRSYGEVAALAGSPGAARAVGQVMASNRVPLVVPCHRVVAAGGRLGGFSAPQGLAMKRRLLALERVTGCTPI
jgi:methylated-DNA-[protein]-cysteine S-methyltransferase